MGHASIDGTEEVDGLVKPCFFQLRHLRLLSRRPVRAEEHLLFGEDQWPVFWDLKFGHLGRGRQVFSTAFKGTEFDQ